MTELNVAGMKLNPVYMEVCDEYVTINGVNMPLQDWTDKDYYCSWVLGDYITKEQKRQREYCTNMWYVLSKCTPFQHKPTSEYGFMYKTYVYNSQIFDVSFLNGRLFGITKYTYNN